jgi:hypothetical protein
MLSIVWPGELDRGRSMTVGWRRLERFLRGLGIVVAVGLAGSVTVFFVGPQKPGERALLTAAAASPQKPGISQAKSELLEPARGAIGPSDYGGMARVRYLVLRGWR